MFREGIAASQVRSTSPCKIMTRSVIMECCFRQNLGHTEHVRFECIADGVLRSHYGFNDGRRFVFLPLLYELVTGELQDWEVAPVFTDLLAGTDITFVQGKVCPTSSSDNCSCTRAKGLNTLPSTAQVIGRDSRNKTISVQLASFEGTTAFKAFHTDAVLVCLVQFFLSRCIHWTQAN